MPRIYTPQALRQGQEIVLESQSSHHLNKVLRVRVNDALQLFNGDGSEWQGRISAINKKNVTVELVSRTENTSESPLHTHLAIAVSKGDRMDFVMQKATELGVSEITPLVSQRTEVKLNAQRWQKKQLHWQQICISACEQSGRSRIPALNPVAQYASWLTTESSAQHAELKLVLHPHQASATQPGRITSAALLIGPEGGFSEEEIQLAVQAGYQPWQLGRRILRTETAPLVALSILQFRWGDLQD